MRLRTTLPAGAGKRAVLMTQQQLAVRIGCTVSSIYNYEAGRMPEVPVLWRMIVLAEETGRRTVAAAFRKQLYADLGIDRRQVRSTVRRVFDLQ